MHGNVFDAFYFLLNKIRWSVKPLKTGIFTNFLIKRGLRCVPLTPGHFGAPQWSATWRPHTISSINLGRTFLPRSRIWKIAPTWRWSLRIYFLSFPRFWGLSIWTVLIFIFDGVTVKTSNRIFGTFNDDRCRCIGPSSLFVSCDNSNQIFCPSLFTSWNNVKMVRTRNICSFCIC